MPPFRLYYIPGELHSCNIGCFCRILLRGTVMRKRYFFPILLIAIGAAGVFTPYGDLEIFYKLGALLPGFLWFAPTYQLVFGAVGIIGIIGLVEVFLSNHNRSTMMKNVRNSDVYGDPQQRKANVPQQQGTPAQRNMPRPPVSGRLQGKKPPAQPQQKAPAPSGDQRPPLRRPASQKPDSPFKD